MQKAIFVLMGSFSLAVLPAASMQQAHAADTTVILVPGAGGAAPNDFLIRNAGRFGSSGLKTRVATSAGEAASAASAISSSGGKAVLVGMSAGAPTVAEAVAQGAPVAGVVFVSGPLAPGPAQRSVVESLGSPQKLPPTLVVHHRNDRCPLTPPSGVATFQAWSGGKARVSWIGGEGSGGGNPCGPMSAHGFAGQDGAAIGAIASFARAR